MKNLSVAQSFMLCALNENGKFPISGGNLQACLVAGGFIDLLLAERVAVTEKKVRVTAPLKKEHLYLESIYNFIDEKGTVKLEKIIENYCFAFSNKKINELTNSVGDSLEARNFVKSEQGGFRGNKELFIPKKDAVDDIIQHIRGELLDGGDLSDEIAALTSLLEKAGILRRYFSSHEKNTLKVRLKEIKKEPSHQIIGKMLDDLDTMLMIMIIAVT